MDCLDCFGLDRHLDRFLDHICTNEGLLQVLTETSGGKSRETMNKQEESPKSARGTTNGTRLEQEWNEGWNGCGTDGGTRAERGVERVG